MRPTLLNFRNPRERTPEFNHPVSLTYKGDRLNFQVLKANKKTSNFPQAKRFPVMENGEMAGNSSTTSAFTGPGRYNDHEDYQKLVKRPCSTVMRKPTAIPATESGKPCYIMIGNSIKFEPAFLATYKQVKEHDNLNLPRENSVSIHASMRTRSVTNLKNLIKDRGIQNIQTSREEMQNSIRQNLQTVKLQVSNTSKSFFKDKNSIQVNTPINYFSSRPTSVSTSKTPAPGKASSRIRYGTALAKEDQSMGSNNFDRSISGYDRSPTNLMNLDTVQEDNDVMKHRSAADIHSLTDVQRVKVKSILPKNAFNYYSLRKGLYLTPSKNRKSSNHNQADPYTIINAYDSVIPVLKSLEKKRALKNQVSLENSMLDEENMFSRQQLTEERQRHSKTLRKLDYDSLNQYMNDILKYSK